MMHAPTERKEITLPLQFGTSCLLTKFRYLNGAIRAAGSYETQVGAVTEGGYLRPRGVGYPTE